MGGLIINVNLSGFDKIRGRIKSSAERAENILATQIAKDTEPFVPMLTGSLVNRTQVKGNMVIYPGPYAHYLYVGKLMVDPVTGSPWGRYGVTKVYSGQKLDIKKNVHPQATDHWFEVSKAQNKEKWLKVAKKVMRREF